MELRSYTRSLILPLVEKDVAATSLEKRQPMTQFKREIMNVLLSLFWSNLPSTVWKDQKFNIRTLET